MSDDARRSAPAVARNSAPLYERLSPELPGTGRILELACGTGEHTAYFAERHPSLVFQPSDPDPAARSSADAWAQHLQLDNVLPALAIDVTQPNWWQAIAEEDWAMMVAVNMIHISPWTACEGLLHGAGALLPSNGALVLYGPYLRDGMETAASNLAFDESLRSRDPSWGIRRLEDVTTCAAEAGFVRTDAHEMPANNLTLVFRKRPGAT